MSIIKRVSPEEAKALIDSDGYQYVDVRSIPEFEAGHPTGAFNVPWKHMGASGASDNDDFLAVMETAFGKEAKIVVGCKSGGRSLAAAQTLAAAGFTNVIDQRAGFMGGMGPGGPEAGWAMQGLPTARQAEPGHSYQELESRLK
jgi:rhodanese-related sulfurtransferase